MSLPLIAKHLETQGRGEDTHLVHMTTGELQSLQALAEKHGGSLTINPATGLPEAGFLSSILPMVAGAALDVMSDGLLTPLMTAGIVGAADAAMTGSLTNGLMAGLGAWSGAGLANDFNTAGLSNIAQEGQNAASKQFLDTQNIANQGTSSFGNMANAPIDTTGGGLTTSQGLGINPSSPEISGGITGSGQSVNPNIPNASPSNAPTTSPSPAAVSRWDAIKQGAFNSSNTGILDSGANALNFAKGHLGEVAGLGMAALGGVSSLFGQQPIPATTSNSNPFGMKTIPRDANGNPIFSASIPTPPNPPYKAVYPNYVQNPYNPATAKRGGLMDVHKYAGGPDYGSMATSAGEIQQGLAEASSPQKLTDMQRALIEAGQENSKNGVYNLSDAEYAKLNPAALMKTHKIAVAQGLQPVGKLGDYETTPAAKQAEIIAQADIEKAASQNTSAKEGGLMAMARGGNIQDGNLGSYSDGGRLLKGPGDGVSDGIPATIGHKQPARLADGEFVIPARIVSELGNGSTDAGAKRLYAMMDRIKAARAKSKDIAADTKAYKYLPA